MVLTVEPGLYVAADAEDAPPELRGIGVRIEDDVLVTDRGPRGPDRGVPEGDRGHRGRDPGVNAQEGEAHPSSSPPTLDALSPKHLELRKLSPRVSSPQLARLMMLVEPHEAPRSSSVRPRPRPRRRDPHGHRRRGGPRTAGRSPATHAPAGAVAQSRVIYLNHTGALLRPGDNDSTTNTSSIVQQQVQVPAWNTDARDLGRHRRRASAICVAVRCQVVDTDPGNVPHIEAIFGGSPTQVGLPSNVGGVSPFTTDCSIIENSIVFTFTAAIPNITSREACEIMAQEVAHSYGLDHELLASDPMTYLSYNGNRAFQDQDVSCGEYQSRQCGINGSVCRATQNSVQLLLARVGQGDAIAPVLMWSTPSDGETVAPGFSVDAAGTDNVAVTGATLLVDGVEAGTQPGAGPFSFATASTLADGPHTLEAPDHRRSQRAVADAHGHRRAGAESRLGQRRHRRRQRPGRWRLAVRRPAPWVAARSVVADRPAYSASSSSSDSSPFAAAGSSIIGSSGSGRYSSTVLPSTCAT